jgi:hypothetical protein
MRITMLQSEADQLFFAYFKYCTVMCVCSVNWISIFHPSIQIFSLKLIIFETFRPCFGLQVIFEEIFADKFCRRYQKLKLSFLVSADTANSLLLWMWVFKLVITFKTWYNNWNTCLNYRERSHNGSPTLKITRTQWHGKWCTTKLREKVITRKLQNGVSWNFIFRSFTKVCPQISLLVKTGQDILHEVPHTILHVSRT